MRVLKAREIGMTTKFSDEDNERIHVAALVISDMFNDWVDSTESRALTDLEQAALVMMGAYAGGLPPLPIGKVYRG